jgi:hypothetical protein
MSPSIFDRIFRDENGNIVIGQMPNLPLIIGTTASVLRLLFSSGEVSLVLDLVAFGSLFTWAWQELFDGVNYFRRGLGLLALLGLIISKVLITQI